MGHYVYVEDDIEAAERHHKKANEFCALTLRAIKTSKVLKNTGGRLVYNLAKSTYHHSKSYLMFKSVI